MDFGAGTGLITAHVAPQVKNITAVDVSQAMLDKLVAKKELHGKVRTVCQDILEQPLMTEFDAIISAMALHHVKDTNKLFKTFAEHLLPGGQIALADLDKEDGTFHPEDVQGVFHHGFERKHLKKILEANRFTDVQFMTAHVVNRDDKEFPIFLVTAWKQ
jgi:2-polyprenyl-3-methyl-5-hydroxy-6-metoxy-1,4-benzoquinol methylase